MILKEASGSFKIRARIMGKRRGQLSFMRKATKDQLHSTFNITYYIRLDSLQRATNMPKVKRDEKDDSDKESSGGSASDSSSSSDGEVAPPSKKTKTSEQSSSSKKKKSEDEHSWELKNNRMLKVRRFKGKVYVDIREYYEKDGKLLPGKKGISMTPVQWQELKELISDVDDSLNEF